MKIIQEARTFMPEILFPGTGLSPVTNKSVIPTNNVVTIQDVLEGKPYRIPSAGGNWGDGEDISTSYKEEGDAYKRDVRDAEILSKMTEAPFVSKENWVVRVPGGYKHFDSLFMAQKYQRDIESKGIKIEWIKRTKTAQNSSKQDIISLGLSSTYKVLVTNYTTGIQSNGAAFCVAPNVFVTCAHVIKKYNKSADEKINILQVERESNIKLVQGNKRYNAMIHAINEKIDIAILKAEIDSTPLKLETKCNVGDDIMAIGSPHGFENNATFGNINSLHRVIYMHDGAPEYMFIDANVFSGNSGGPIVNVNSGFVVGMVTAIAASQGEYGLNAGLPSYYINRFLKEQNITVDF